MMDDTDEKITEKKITVRFLEAQFTGIQILLDYMNSLNNKTSRAVMKKYFEETAIEGDTLDQSEAVFGFLAYILRNSAVLEQVDLDKRKSDLASMAIKFIKLNGLALPSPGYINRLYMPQDEHVSRIIRPGK